jgi:hypothetical protein
VRRIPYPVVCALLGLAIGWVPMLLHGPIPEKYDILYIQGAIAVWGWYLARLLIGLMIGITWWPRPWWLRGPLIGLLMMFPLGWVSLATPGCGFPCQFWNAVTGAVIGIAVAGGAYLITGRTDGSAT